MKNLKSKLEQRLKLERKRNMDIIREAPVEDVLSRERYKNDMTDAYLEEIVSIFKGKNGRVNWIKLIFNLITIAAKLINLLQLRRALY